MDKEVPCPACIPKGGIIAQRRMTLRGRRLRNPPRQGDMPCLADAEMPLRALFPLSQDAQRDNHVV